MTLRDNEALRAEVLKLLYDAGGHFPGDPPTTEFADRILATVDRHLAADAIHNAELEAKLTELLNQLLGESGSRIAAARHNAKDHAAYVSICDHPDCKAKALVADAVESATTAPVVPADIRAMNGLPPYTTASTAGPIVELCGADEGTPHSEEFNCGQPDRALAAHPRKAP